MITKEERARLRRNLSGHAVVESADYYIAWLLDALDEMERERDEARLATHMISGEVTTQQVRAEAAEAALASEQASTRS